MKILFQDIDHPLTRTLTRFRSFASIRNGIFTPLERVRIRHPGAEIFFAHPDPGYERIIAGMEGLIPRSEREEKDFDLTIDSSLALPVALLENCAATIADDVALFSPDAHQESVSPLSCTVVGPKERLIIHPAATLLPGSVVDVSNGSVIIDEGARISPFCFIEGPAYIGKQARVDNARITGGCVIGHEVRLGGEIENSIINDFSNKHHEGFLGHSVLGSWVNLGALVTTSDLKNNYGEVRLLLPESRIPGTTLTSIGSGTIKFGSLIGDCVKVAIGTMLNTGTILDAGSNLFGGSPGKYLPPLSWGIDGTTRYDLERFEQDQKKIFARRNRTANPGMFELARPLSGQTVKF